ncbi:hypothetical protein EVAR_10122_1 [Eumeta japonica]|uniref:Uncharacterized protein n=1 Tax=Eumeta variegata TaxID=151549 RepID=A0A4C1UC55_EUMVA|nr:hypothetical protein EVAR_10122_1 [Eumeta japonica]
MSEPTRASIVIRRLVAVKCGQLDCSTKMGQLDRKDTTPSKKNNREIAALTVAFGPLVSKNSEGTKWVDRGRRPFIILLSSSSPPLPHISITSLPPPIATLTIPSLYSVSLPSPSVPFFLHQIFYSYPRDRLHTVPLDDRGPERLDTWDETSEG